ncbi:MAG: hypothetical protein NTV74_02110 [Euryarchaeota archaeon]|nr:hypothetical protein [Euryarchaeota archaeon]
MILSLVALSIIPTYLSQGISQSKLENDSTLILEKKDLGILVRAKLLCPNIEEKALIQTIINQIYARGAITQQNISDICATTGWKLLNSEFEVDDSTFLLFPGLVPSLFIGYMGPVAYGRWIDGIYLEQWCNGFFIGGIIVWGRQGFHQEGRLPIWGSNLQGQCRVGFYKVVID